MKSLKRRPNRKPYTNPALATSLLAKLVGQPKSWLGVKLIYMPPGIKRGEGGHLSHDPTGTWMLPGQTERYKSRHEAVKAWLAQGAARQFGDFELRHRGGEYWFLSSVSSRKTLECFPRKPSRQHLAQVIKKHRQRDSKPSYARPDTLGWRTWAWDATNRCLRSPHTKTLWDSPEHRVPEWSTEEAVRGHAGVHACRLPRGDWRYSDKPADMPAGIIVGLVERFGKFVLGTEGWRAEWVIIRELMAPNEFFAEELRRAYPEVVVHVAEQTHWSRSFIK